MKNKEIIKIKDAPLHTPLILGWFGENKYFTDQINQAPHHIIGEKLNDKPHYAHFIIVFKKNMPVTHPKMPINRWTLDEKYEFGAYVDGDWECMVLKP